MEHLILITILLFLSVQGQKQPVCTPKTPLAVSGGGVVVNADMNFGVNGWEAFGQAQIQIRQTTGGSNYIVVTNRIRSTDYFTQFFKLKNNHPYIVSALLQVSQGTAKVTPIMSTVSGLSVSLGDLQLVRSSCRTELKSEFDFNVSEPVQRYFESQNVRVDIWADNISLLPVGDLGRA